LKSRIYRPSSARPHYLAAVMVLVSCATPSDTKEPLLALKGHSQADVVRALGRPHREDVIAGHRVLHYAYSAVHASGAFWYSPLSTEPEDFPDAPERTPVARRFYCNIDYVIDNAHVVHDVRIDTNVADYYCPRLD